MTEWAHGDGRTLPGLSGTFTAARGQGLRLATAEVLACDLAVLLATVLAAPLLTTDSLAFPYPRAATSVALAAAVTLVLAGTCSGLYSGRWRTGSFEEMRACLLAVAATTAVAVVADLALGAPIPPGAALATGPTALLGLAVLRSLRRLRHDRLATPAPTAAPVVVFGAGDAGARMILSMLRAENATYVPVALLDDDPTKQRLRLHGVPVLGTRLDLESVARGTGSETLLIAIPSAGADLIRDLADRAGSLGMRVRVLPTVKELFDGDVHVSDLRAVSFADLLGRRETEIDIDSVASYLTGRRVLITGAGGSIGSELSRQVEKYAPASLVLLDRDESALHALQLSLTGRAMLDDDSLVVADIRDRERVLAVFQAHQPEVVFHAAALKHLTLLESHPHEGVKTNVWGTWNVLQAAAATGVGRFVNISTDKAADPTSVLGYTKRITERLTSWFASREHAAFLSVRFGNVLGSRGSVLTAFAAQVETGGPLTVTHPDVTRYFMTIEESVRLVIQAGAIGSGGQALVLDMGEPVRIADVARRLAEAADRSIELDFTGLRPGEKLHEVLLAADEPDNRPVHPLIAHVEVPPLAPGSVRGLDLRLGRAEMTAWCRMMAALPVGQPGPVPAQDITLDLTAHQRSGDLYDLRPQDVAKQGGR
jgi:FlaA1/EpsC-like NDP-sugar epimerase